MIAEFHALRTLARVTFELPPTSATTAAELRDLEQNAPNVTPKAIRAALIQAAVKLESHEKQCAYCIRLLNEALNLRTGVMDSEARAHENERRTKQAMQEVVERLGVLASVHAGESGRAGA